MDGRKTVYTLVAKHSPIGQNLRMGGCHNTGKAFCPAWVANTIVEALTFTALFERNVPGYLIKGTLFPDSSLLWETIIGDLPDCNTRGLLAGFKALIRRTP